MDTSEPLPAPESVVDRAAELAARTADAATDPGAVNVRVAPVDGGFDPGTVERGTDGYEGPNAGDIGRLAAAVGATERVDPGRVSLRHPEPTASGDAQPTATGNADPTVAEGPWLVVEPLAGRLSTVHAGRGRLAVDLVDPPTGVDAGLCAVRDALVDLLEAVRPDHDHYPVERDVEGVFTRGMTTLSLAGVDAATDGTTVGFDVSTTPETRGSAVEGLVADLECVGGVRYEPVVDLARGDPPSSLLRAAEAAAEAAVGDWEYEWYPGPTAFSDLPTEEKLALGTGLPGRGSFGRDEYEDCLAMLRGTVERYGGT